MSTTPFWSIKIDGVIDDNGRLPGAIEFGDVFLREKIKTGVLTLLLSIKHINVVSFAYSCNKKTFYSG